MLPSSVLESLGISSEFVSSARAWGTVVGRGEGFVTREWRPGDGRIVVAHLDASGAELTCAQGFLAGLPWTPWSLARVSEGAACPHCATAKLRAGGIELEAVVPDYAARRKMFPVGLDVQAQVLVAVGEWQLGAAADAVARVESGAPGAVVVSGTVTASARDDRDVLRCSMSVGELSLTLAGPVSDVVRVGERVTATGCALVRVGAPVHKRSPPQ